MRDWLGKYLDLMEAVLEHSEEDNVILFPTEEERRLYREAKKQTKGVRTLRKQVEKYLDLKEKRDKDRIYRNQQRDRKYKDRRK